MRRPSKNKARLDPPAVKGEGETDPDEHEDDEVKDDDADTDPGS